MTRGLAHPDEDIYVRPSARLVARVWDDCGEHAACERWFWLGKWTLQRMAVEGRAEARKVTGATPIRGYHRSTTPEQEAEGVAAVLRLGTIDAACAETGLHYTTVRRAMRERGVQPPRVDRRDVALRAAATRRARAAA